MSRYTTILFYCVPTNRYIRTIYWSENAEPNFVSIRMILLKYILTTTFYNNYFEVKI